MGEVNLLDTFMSKEDDTALDSVVFSKCDQIDSPDIFSKMEVTVE